MDDLFTDYVCESGPQHRYLNGDTHLTQQLARTQTIHSLRIAFHLLGKGEGTWEFGVAGVFWATVDSVLEGDPTRYGYDIPQLNITHFLGTFNYRVEEWGSKVRFQIDNETNLESGSRLPPPLGVPVNQANDYDVYSVEELIEQDSRVAWQPLWQVIAQHKVISILKAKERDPDFQSGLGGGTMRQTFVWLESYSLFSCFEEPLLRWPLINNFLKIENSNDFLER